MKTFELLTAGVLTAAVALGSDTVLAQPAQQKPNIVMIMSTTCHNPNNPSPRWKGKSLEVAPISTRLWSSTTIAAKWCRRFGISVSRRTPSSSGPPTMAPGSMPGPTPATRPSAEKRVRPLKRIPRSCHRLVARPHQAGLGQHGYVLAHGLVADLRQTRRARAAPA